MNLTGKRAVLLLVAQCVAASSLVVAACSSNESIAPSEVVLGADAGDGAIEDATLLDAPDVLSVDARARVPRAPERRGRWIPPRPWHQGLCTPAEVSELAAACFESEPNAPACTTFIKEHPACLACAMSQDTDPTRGPIISFANNNYWELNFVGCIANALGDTSVSGCGAAYGQGDDCARVSCSGCLPIESQAGVYELRACMDAKEISKFCALEFNLFGVRCGALSDTSPDNPINTCKNDYSVRDYVTMWCGSPADAGTDAGDSGASP